MKQLVTAAVCIAMTLAVPGAAMAYRPFVSTDAAVADPRELEIELGAVTVAHSGRENTFTAPSVVLNYGFLEQFELVAEGRLQEGATTELVEPALSVKAVLREGVLQEKEGPSLAVEAGMLLPSTERGEHGVGFEAVGILTGRVAPVTFHLNAGGGVDRSQRRPFGVWGLIGEVPLTERLRLVSEVNGEAVRAERASNSVLAGLIWQPTASNVFLDVAVRRGLTGGASDWEVTAGVTFGLRLPGAPGRAGRQ